MIPYTNSEIQFQLITEIGEEGRNSQVFISHDNQLDTQLVVKRIDRTTFTHEDEYFQEASILYKVHILTLFQYNMLQKMKIIFILHYHIILMVR